MQSIYAIQDSNEARKKVNEEVFQKLLKLTLCATQRKVGGEKTEKGKTK